MGSGTLVGTGAQFRQYLEIEDGTKVEARPVVKSIEFGETVVEIPVGPMRPKGGE
jgi:hypothetical protein